MADPKLTIVGDSAKAEAAVVALEKKVDKLQHQLRMTSRVARKAGQQTKQAFGASAINSIGSYAAQVAGVTAAITTAIAATQKLNQVRDEAAQKNRDSVPGLAKLSQIAIDAPDLQRLISAADKLRSQGVGSNLNESADFLFNLESGGIKGADRATITGLAQNQIVGDPAQFTAALKQLQTAVGQAETGSLTDIASKAFAASGHALATADQLLASTARGGTSASSLGLRDEEILSATAVLSNASNASEAGTQIKAMLQSLQNQGGFTGMNLESMLANVSSRGLDDAGLNKFFGSSEATAGFRVLTGNLQAYSEALADVDKAVSRNIANMKIQMPGQIARLDAGLLANQSEATLDASRVDEGTLRNLRVAMENEMQRNVEGKYGGTIGALFGMQSGLGRMTTSDETFLSSPLNQASVGRSNPDLLARVNKNLEKMVEQNAQLLRQNRGNPRRNED